MSIRLGRLFGIPLDMDISWLIILGLFTYTIAVGYFRTFYPAISPAAGWALALLTSLLFFATLIGHELSHCYFARKAGIPIAGITLFIFGGVARLTSEPTRPGEELKMAAAGPAFSILVGTAAWGIALLAPAESAVRAVFAYLAIANIFVAVFNMLPGFPMDGGRVLRALLWAWTRNLRKATHAASLVGQTLAWTMIGFGLFSVIGWGTLSGLWFVFIGWFLNNAAQGAYQQLLMRRALEGLGVSEMITRGVEVIDPHISVEELVREHFLKTRLDAYPVANGEDTARIVTPEDIRQLSGDAWATTTVEDVARPIPDELSLDAGEDAWQAVQKLQEVGAKGHLMVLDGGRVLGLLSRDDVGRLIRSRVELQT